MADVDDLDVAVSGSLQIDVEGSEPMEPVEPEDFHVDDELFQRLSNYDDLNLFKDPEEIVIDESKDVALPTAEDRFESFLDLYEAVVRYASSCGFTVKKDANNFHIDSLSSHCCCIRSS
jgi:hypothetical protein